MSAELVFTYRSLQLSRQIPHSIAPLELQPAFEVQVERQRPPDTAFVMRHCKPERQPGGNHTMGEFNIEALGP